MRLLFVVSLLILFPAVGGAARGADPDYARDIQPLFVKYCNGCHNPDDREGKLSLDTYDELLKGGKRGAEIVVGQPGQSRLLRVLTGEAEPAMPPKDNDKPKEQEIALIKAWLTAGAKGPQGAAPDPAKIVVPVVKPRGTVRRPITAVAFGANGQQVAAGRYGVVEVLDAKTRLPVRTLGREELVGQVTELIVTPNGKKLLAAAGQPGLFGQIVVFDWETGKPVLSFRGHRDSLYAAAISPDEKLIATGGYDQQIKLWNMADGKEVKTLTGHNGAIQALAFRKDGQVLASASGDRTVKLWNVMTGERLDTLSEAIGDMYTLAFTPDGKRLLTGGGDNRIRIYNVSESAKEGTNSLVAAKIAHEGALVKLAFSPDAKSLVSAADDRTVKLWEVEPLGERRLLEKQTDGVAALAVAADNRTVALGRMDGTLSLIDIETGKEIAPAPPAKPELTAIWPRGVQIGQSTTLKIAGKDLKGASVKSDSEQLSVTIVAEKEGGMEMSARVTAAAGTSVGPHDVWLVGPGGESAHLKIFVDNLPQVLEHEPNDRPERANAVAVPATVWGELATRGDVDCYAVDLRQGQMVIFDVASTALGSKGNLTLSVLDPQGHEIASNNDLDSDRDPFLAVKIPTTGRYTAQVRELLFGGGPDQGYRLTVGALPFAVGCYPLGVPAKVASKVGLIGFNLPPDAAVELKPGEPGQKVAIEWPAGVRGRKGLSAVVGSFAELREGEPNDQPAKANSVAIPCTVNGRIDMPGDVDLFRFTMKQGQAWVIETEAARLGSPVDTKIEVLHADGRPVERLLMQAVRDSYINFKSIDAVTRDIRVKNWEEMNLNEWLYVGGEVTKIFRMPQGPDSGFQLYDAGGNKRRTYFDTSATTHANQDAAYIVEPHPPGTKLVSSGLPVFTLHYANDDDGWRKLGTDSRLTFTAPADGDYLVRVTDARGYGGERYAYRLTVRPPAPDFTVKVTGENPVVNAGSGKEFTVTAERIDDFNGDIRVDVAGQLPPGFAVATPLVIQAGHLDATGVISASAAAPAPTAANWSAAKLTATGTVNGKPMTKEIGSLGKIGLAEKPKLIVTLYPDGGQRTAAAGGMPEIVVTPGTTVPAMLRIERNGFTDRVNIEVDNLPHGVIVSNIGLNAVLIPEGETERQIFIEAAKWVPETTRQIHAVAKAEGNQTSLPIRLRVGK